MLACPSVVQEGAVELGLRAWGYIALRPHKTLLYAGTGFVPATSCRLGEIDFRCVGLPGRSSEGCRGVRLLFDTPGQASFAETSFGRSGLTFFVLACPGVVQGGVV